MESARQQKINKLLQKDLGVIFQLESRNIMGTGAMITVTKVSVTKDLSIAKIYLSIFAAPEKDILIKQIQRKKAAFRNLLAQKVRHQLRVIPDLIFELDDSLDYIENIDNLLKS